MADSKHPHGEHPSTAVLTRGFDPRLSVWSARPAVFRTSTFVFPTPEAAERAFDITSGREQLAPGESEYLVYSRFNHPNAEILQDQMVPLEENAEWALAFNSGLAAIMTALLTVLKPGDSIIYTMPLYGGTMGMMHNLLEPFGIHTIPVPTGHSEALDEAIRTTPMLRVVLIETPANPTMVMADIKRTALACEKLDPRPLLMVDNTFLGPVFQHPLTLGADLVLYSATKYLGGFSDLLAGMVLGRDPDLRNQMFGKRGMFGNILQPDECWILDGRLPTVCLRMNRQSKNAQRIAESLVRGPKSARSTTRRCSTIRSRSASACRSAIIRARCSPSTCTAAKPRLSISCEACGWPKTPCRWAAWKRWSATRRRPRIRPAMRKR